MAQTIVMPKLGLTMTEGTIAMWQKKEGEAVKAGEGLFDVETDKLTNTIEASADGILLKILHPDGATVPCLTPGASHFCLALCLVLSVLFPDKVGIVCLYSEDHHAWKTFRL